MKYRKFNRYEKKEINRQVLANALSGEGYYLYENNNNAELTLPRPTKSGIRKIGPRQQFQGDNYYMQLVRSGDLRLIKELQSPVVQERSLNEESSMEDKLILDQPDVVTVKGKVEHVLDTSVPKQKLNESDTEGQPEVLLNENPVEGGFVIVDA